MTSGQQLMFSPILPNSSALLIVYLNIVVSFPLSHPCTLQTRIGPDKLATARREPSLLGWTDSIPRLRSGTYILSSANRTAQSAESGQTTSDRDRLPDSPSAPL
jgi:hypothetical protein